MNGRDFLTVAGDLATGVHEAEWRSAVSRAYYGAFHVARALLKQCGFTTPYTDQVHAYLWLRLANCGHPDIQNAGHNLNHLRTVRNWADYDLARPMDQAAALAEVLSAEDVVRLLEDAAREATVRTQITDAMKIYERDVLGEVTWRP